MDWLKEILHKIIEMFNLDTFEYSNILFALGVVLMAFMIEWFSVGWKKSSIKRILQFDRTIRNDIISWLLIVFNLFNVLAFILSLGICYYLTILLHRNVDFQLIDYVKSAYLQFAIIFIIGDFKNYWSHYFFHRFGPMWKLHEYHHSATHLSILTTYRGHFLERSIASLFDIIPYVILGVPIQVFFLVAIIKEVHLLLIHSSIRSDWGIIGKYVLVSPSAHRLHHSIETRHYQKNFGSNLIIWDRIFGTYHPHEQIDEIGIIDNNFNKRGYVYDIYQSGYGFFESLIKLVRKPFS